MSAPLKLPKCIIYIPILIEWLDVIDVCLLDSAVTNRKTRNVFLEYIDFDRTVLDGLKERPLSTLFLSWVHARNIAVRDINILFTPVLYPEQTVWNFWSSEMITTMSCELFPEGAKYCSKVRSLTLTNANKIHPEMFLDHHNNNGISSLPCLVHCTHLRELIVVDYSFGMETNLFEIPEALSVGNSPTNRSRCVNTLAIAKNLQTLELRQCYEITFNAISYILDNCSRLSSLSITATKPTIFHDKMRRNKNMNGEFGSNSSIPKPCPQLTTLNLSDCGRLWDGTLMAIADRCNYLLNINIQQCSTITDAALEHIGKSCLCLLEFNCNSCAAITEAGIDSLASGCHFLQKIDMSHNWVIKDGAILALAEHCPQLTYLNINDCYQITDTSMSRLFESCTALQELHCEYCIHISDDSEAVMETYCPDLRAFSAGGCINITNVSMLSNACPNISTLRMFKSSSLSDDDVIAFATYASQLTVLDVSDCIQVSDLSLITIGGHCPLLVEFLATNCINITDVGVITLATQCRRLKLLDIENCQAITYDSIDAINTFARQLTELRVHEVISDIVASDDHFTNDGYWSYREYI